MPPVTKRDRELFVLKACLSRLWGGHDTWGIISKQDRPDFVVRAPDGTTLGAEVTELLTPVQGEGRSLDSRLNLVTIEVLTEWLADSGQSGAMLVGENTSTPSRREDLEPFRKALRTHLEQHGDARLRKLHAPFHHQWGQIQALAPWDWPEIHLTGTGWGPHLAYMKGRPQKDIERDLVQAVERKVVQSRAYDTSWPLWLLVGNRSQGLNNVDPGTVRLVRQAAAARFLRVVLANLPMGTRDARPPFPHTIDLL